MRASRAGVSVSRSGITSDTTNPIATTHAADSRTCRSATPCQRARPVTSAPAMARMAPPSGAMTIAPMIEATESWNRPNDETRAARESSTT